MTSFSPWCGVEHRKLSNLEFQPSYESNDRDAVRYAIDHTFERRSVVEERKLYETAIRYGIGSVTPEGIQEEASRQGLLVKEKESTTRSVLEEEGRIIDFAREGRGTCRPLRAEYSASLDPLGQRSPVNEPNSIRSRHSNLDTATLPAFAQEKSRPDESKRPAVVEQLHAQRTPTSFDYPATLSPEQQAMVSGRSHGEDRSANHGKGQVVSVPR